jgi:hypothetical protein
MRDVVALDEVIHRASGVPPGVKGQLGTCGVSGKMVEKIKSVGVDPGSWAMGLMGCGPESSLVDGYSIREAGLTKCDPAPAGCPKLINRGARNRRVFALATLPRVPRASIMSIGR